MTGDTTTATTTTTSRCGVEQRLPQHPIKTDEIEILESAGGEEQPDKVQTNRKVFQFYILMKMLSIFHFEL